VEREKKLRDEGGVNGRHDEKVSRLRV
jgi:hypothetical protein